MKFLSKYYDWILAICGLLVVLALAATIGFLIYANSQNRGNTVDDLRFRDEEFNTPFYPVEPPDAQYPPPAKEQRTFYATYDEAPIQYNVEWSVRNKVRNPEIGGHEFTIKLYNSLNKPVAFNADESAPFTIGCIARDDPYRTVAVERQAFTFEPYETKQIKLPVDVSCLYLGTADGQYFWRIY